MTEPVPSYSERKYFVCCIYKPLQTGYLIEGLPSMVFPMTLNGMTYHPQNEALRQWFEFESPSSAIDSAYSYPDETTLTALSPPQKFGCQ